MSIYQPLSKKQIASMKTELKRVECPNCGEQDDLLIFLAPPDEWTPYADIQFVCEHCKVLFTHFGCTLRDPYHRPLGRVFINQGKCPYYHLIQPVMFPRQKIRIEGDKPPYTLITTNVETEED